MSTPITGTRPISSPNWQRPRAATSYMLESPTVAFPEPQLYRATSANAHSSPPSAPGPISRPHLGASLHITPGLSHRNSFFGLRAHSTEVAFGRLHLQVETRRSYIFSSSKRVSTHSMIPVGWNYFNLVRPPNPNKSGVGSSHHRHLRLLVRTRSNDSLSCLRSSSRN